MVYKRGLRKMKVVVIYSNERKGSTYNCVKIFKSELQKYTEVEFTEFYLTKDLPELCIGCFTCFSKGEDKCPHAKYAQPIVKALLECDGFILASPVYACDLSGAMKAFFDHLCYMWVTHRPAEEMFKKVGMAITTTAGAGARTSLKSLKKSPRYWCVKKVLGYKAAVAAAKWEEIKPAKQEKIVKALQKRAKQFVTAIEKPGRSPFITKVMFRLIGKMVSGYKPGDFLYRDTKYWKDKGWPDVTKPFC